MQIFFFGGGGGGGGIKTEKKILEPLLLTMNHEPSNITDAEGRVGFTPFKFILELLLKLREMQSSPIQFYNFLTKSK